MKYTAIWVDSWMMGSQRVSLTKMYRFEHNDPRTIMVHLAKEGIADATIFLFKGWPKLQGEREEDVYPGYL